MTTINIYLTFNGNCDEAFDFYKSIFGGDFAFKGHFKDMPSEAGHQIPEEDAEKIMHISLPISKETVLMGSDSGGEWGANYQQGNNFSISINTDSKENADKFFNRLSENGQVTMPMDQTFWSDYFGMLTDKFGINWMIGLNEKSQE